MEKIRKHFGELLALNEVGFSLKRGEIHGLLGENGAGKSTLMNILYGLYRADSGEIYLEGKFEFFPMMPFVGILIIMAIFKKHIEFPAAIGEPYSRE